MTRTPIDVTSADRHVHADDAVTALNNWNEQHDPHPEIYLRGDVLTRVVNIDGDTKLQPFTQPALLELLGRAAIFGREKSGNVVQVPPPMYVAQALLGRAPTDLPGIPTVNRVTDVPVYGADAADGVHTTPGYQASSRSYFAPAPGMAKLSVGGGWDPADPHEQNIRDDEVGEARRFLWELVRDFPFADPASKAHAFCMILEPFVRELIGNEPTPMYVVQASTPGTGKSLLTRVCLGVGAGRVSVQTYTPDQDELRKRLTAVLMEGRSAVMLDNLPNGAKVDSPVLAAALTASRWTDRVLGSTRMLDVPIRNVWAMTGNNVNLSRELTRRCVPIFLDTADGSDPLERPRTDFRHPNLEKWAAENRADLVSAALTLVQNWAEGEYTGGFDEDTGEIYNTRVKTQAFLGSYPEWSNVLGGILRAAGGQAFLGNLDTLHADSDSDTAERGTFLADWFERTQDSIRLDDVITLINGSTLNGEPTVGPITLPLELRGVRPEELPQKLGYWLRRHKRENMGGYRIVKHEGRHGRWAVEKVG